MAQCRYCQQSGIFLRVDAHGVCPACARIVYPMIQAYNRVILESLDIIQTSKNAEVIASHRDLMLEKLAHLEVTLEQKGIPVYDRPVAEMKRLALEGADERILQLLEEEARKTHAKAAAATSSEEKTALYTRFWDTLVELEFLMHDPSPLLPFKEQLAFKIREHRIDALIEQAEKAEFKEQWEEALALYQEALYELMNDPALYIQDERVRWLEARIAALRGWT